MAVMNYNWPRTPAIKPDFPSVLTGAPIQEEQRPGFNFNNDALMQIVLGLAMMDAGIRPQRNPPTVMETFAPMMQLQARLGDKQMQLRQQEQDAEIGRNIFRNAPPPISSVETDVPGGLFAPTASGQSPGDYRDTGVEGLSAGGALGRYHDPRGKIPVIIREAIRWGIDPAVAVRVANTEGLQGFQSSVVNKTGVREPSWGAFQLYTGGGEGNNFQRDTGLDPSDPKNEDATISYALQRASQVGWGPWHGAKKAGIGEWEGIRRPSAQQVSGPPDTVVGQPAGGMAGVAPVPVSSPGGAPESVAPGIAPPTSMPPPEPSSARGTAMQRMLAQQSIDYWTKVQIWAGARPERKGYLEAANGHIEESRKFLTEEQNRRLDAYWKPRIAQDTKRREKIEELRVLPTELLIKQKFRENDPDFNIELQAELARRRAAAEASGKISGTLAAEGLTDQTSPEYQARARQLATDNRPEAVKLIEAANSASPEERAIIIGAITGQAPTTDVKNTEWYAKQPQHIRDIYDRLQAGGRQLNIGNVPVGYQVVPLPGGGFRQEVIPGSPTAEKQEAAQSQQVLSGALANRAINQALSLSSYWTTGLVGSQLARIPGFPPYDLARALDTLKAQTSFESLNEMRLSSPTGAALGPVSDFENRMLQATRTNLEQSQSKERFESNLLAYRDVVNYINHGVPGLREQLKQGVITREQYNEGLRKLVENLTVNIPSSGNAETSGQPTRPSTVPPWRVPESTPAPRQVPPAIVPRPPAASLGAVGPPVATAPIPPVPGPVGKAPPGKIAIPYAEAAAILRSNPTPDNRASFDLIYGDGEAERVLGD